MYMSIIKHHNIIRQYFCTIFISDACNKSEWLIIPFQRTDEAVNMHFTTVQLPRV